MRFWRAVPLGRTALLNSALVLVLVGGGVWAYFMINGDGTPAAATTVRTVAVAQGKVTATVTADGTVASANTMSADFTTAGTVTAIKVKVGDRVAKGATLATVDATEVTENLATARRNRSAAAEALDRAEDGGDDSSIANAENQLDQADAAVKSAQRAVDGTVLKAPMAGTVVAISGAVGGSSGGSGGGSGSSSGSSSGFVQLADLTKLKVSASVAEADATRLKLDQAATVAWNALSGVTATGRVTAISPTASSGNTVAYPIEVALDSIPEGTRLGQTVSLTVTVDEVDGAVYVPAAAVKTAGGRTTVTVVANGVQETRAVQIGLKGDSYTVIVSGLEVGEQVVLATVTSTTNNQQFPGGGPGGFTGGGFGGGPGTGGTGTNRGTR
ncbi:efflux RND transporter periplasmic adaptor subunit [Catellatospora sp. KI3]|uniref:efflux RND transporter periplasmic adaptor subunit n=1 Tax=Catellatospora sp. KI3 TaxID=3041620 RepID=UPI0024831F3D|nr:efflux RND transporter periplasmic adaptor subunit [Catellatospora sp. KI3]MDI1461787.1 efflux RND transporter periplasmic adaptor subunit [Catellatospora sp. KI3]